MYEDLFNKLHSRNALEENIRMVCESMTWEQIALALYGILDDIDTADDMCKENAIAFRNMVMKLQAKKNILLQSPDGYRVEPVVDIDEAVKVKNGLPRSQAKLLGKDGSVRGRDLTKSPWGFEPDWRKFWLLTNGKLVAVSDSHSKTAGGERERDVLLDDGAVAGYVVTNGELGLGSFDKLTTQQIATVKSLAIEFKATYFVTEFHNQVFPIKTIDHLDYMLRYGVVDEGLTEAVATELSKVEQTFKDYYKDILNGTLIKSTWGGVESGWYKFWLLTDGTIVPVRLSHLETVMASGSTTYTILADTGAQAGYIAPEQEEMGLRSSKMKLTPEQISAVVKLYNEWPINMMRMDQAQHDSSYVTNSRELVQYLRTGKSKERKPWESVKESLSNFAKYELDLAGMFDKDADYDGMLGEAVMELIELFGSQDHSGMSAAMTIDLFDRLASYKPLSELTDNPTEWMDVSEELWQSRRNPVCFSNDGGRTYYDIDELEEGSERKFHTSKHWGEEVS